jgi:TonB family protein
MFEATLQAASPDHQRFQRLMLASMIALASTTSALAIAWTLERMHIDRIAGPVQKFELAHLSLLPPPKLIEPPPPPPIIEDRGGDGGGSPDPTVVDDTEPAITGAIDEVPTKLLEPPRKGLVGQGILGPPIGCPACVGPDSADRTGYPLPPIAKRPESPPTEVEFSALRCLACADPDHDALRKTTSGLRGSTGTVSVRFCVDVRGRVEADSIEIEESFGDAAVDRITRTAVGRWRFSPMKVGNQPRRACSRAEFNIRFD